MQIEKAAEHGGEPPADPADGSLSIGSLKFAATQRGAAP